MLGKGKGAAALTASRKAFFIGLFPRRRSVVTRVMWFRGLCPFPLRQCASNTLRARTGSSPVLLFVWLAIRLASGNSRNFPMLFLPRTGADHSFSVGEYRRSAHALRAIHELSDARIGITHRFVRPAAGRPEIAGAIATAAIFITTAQRRPGLAGSPDREAMREQDRSGRDL